MLGIRPVVTATLSATTGSATACGARHLARLAELLQEAWNYARAGLMETVYAATGINIPESDYPQVATVGGLIAYIAGHG